MGKSTAAGFFMAQDIPVWDADSAVHRLYSAGGDAVSPLATAFPLALIDEAISRPALRAIIAADPTALGRIEAIVHPLVAADRAAFVANSRAWLVVLGVPLLFENGTEAHCDATLLVTAPAALQRQRVLSRAGMTQDHLTTILARQMPDAQKRALATHIVETLDLPSTQAYVSALIALIRAAHA